MGEIIVSSGSRSQVFVEKNIFQMKKEQKEQKEQRRTKKNKDEQR